MTTANIINTLRQGVPVTARLVREIIAKLDRLDWAERSLKAALESYGAGKVQFTRDECGYVCDALEECERLKEAVRWERECDECATALTMRARWISARDASALHMSARAEVDRLLEAT